MHSARAITNAVSDQSGQAMLVQVRLLLPSGMRTVHEKGIRLHLPIADDDVQTLYYKDCNGTT